MKRNFCLALAAICTLMLAGSPSLAGAQTAYQRAWNVLEDNLTQTSAGQRLAGVRALGIIYENSHAAELAEKALKDSSPAVRPAAATALGQMHARSAEKELKEAVGDKQLPVVMAAAHALQLLNDPACYEVYYEIFTGERRSNSGMISQEIQVMHDPKQLAEMGFNEGIGYVPFAGMGWDALQTIMKDRKSGAAAKAALIAALATDPDKRTTPVLVKATEDKNWVLRMAALEALAKRGDASVLPKIEPALNDPRKEVQNIAAAAVIRLNDLARLRKENEKAAAAAPINHNKAEKGTGQP